MHILVVEDEKALCDTIARSLRRLAYSVDCCYDGQSALDMLSIEKFDLVVLDLNLTEKDSLTVLKTLRKAKIGKVKLSSRRLIWTSWRHESAVCRSAVSLKTMLSCPAAISYLILN